MSVTVSEYTFPSATGVCDIKGKRYVPDSPKGIFQISHGMAEHIGRYEEFANYLAGEGWAVYIHNHAGHGESVKDDSMLGYFGEENGDKALVDDIKKANDLARSEFPGLKVVLLGHSMGSFIARAYCAKYPETIDAAVICGTSGPVAGNGLAIIIANAQAKKNGSMYKSALLDKLAFGSYLKRIPDAKTDKDWLSHNEENVAAYVADKYSGFTFTVRGMRDMFNLLSGVSSPEWYDKVPATLPMFFIAGEEDPVGQYGKGVAKVVDFLKKTGHKRVGMKLYPGDRHEILNELDRAQVYADVCEWAGRQI